MNSYVNRFYKLKLFLSKKKKPSPNCPYPLKICTSKTINQCLTKPSSRILHQPILSLSQPYQLEPRLDWLIWTNLAVVSSSNLTSFQPSCSLGTYRDLITHHQPRWKSNFHQIRFINHLAAVFSSAIFQWITTSRNNHVVIIPPQPCCNHISTSLKHVAIQPYCNISCYNRSCTLFPVVIFSQFPLIFFQNHTLMS